MSGPGSSGAGSLALPAAEVPGARALCGRVQLSLSLGSGAVLSASLAPGSPTVLGWLAPVPLLLALRHARRPIHAYALAAIAGLVFWVLHVRWILEVPGANAASFSLALVLLVSVFGLIGLGAWLGRSAPVGTRWVVVASTWAAVEYLRLHLGFLSMPWGMLAYSQIDLAPVAQFASVAGFYGVSFVVVAAAASFAEALHQLLQRSVPSGRERWELTAPLLLCAAVLGWGALRIAPPAPPRLQVALIQAGVYERGVDPRERRRELLEEYGELTRRAVADGADLVAWPASSIPGSIPFDSGLVRWLEVQARELETPLLVGSSGQQKSAPGLRERPTANSAFLIAANGEVADHYDKVRLLPFNEYVPLRGLLHWPSWVSANRVDARAGTRRTIFEAAGARFGVLICWENLFPDGFRRSADRGLDFVVSMTNEAFTGDRGAHHQMLSMNRYRAVENGIAVIRTATTGVSVAIDRYGRMTDVVSNAAGDTEGVVGYRVASLPPAGPPTLYARFGDWFPAACAMTALALLCGPSIARRLAGAAPES